LISAAEQKKIDETYAADSKKIHDEMLADNRKHAEEVKKILEEQALAVSAIYATMYDVQRKTTFDSNQLIDQSIGYKLSTELNYALANNEIEKNRAMESAAIAGKSVEEINAIEEQYDAKRLALQAESANKFLLNERQTADKITSLKVDAMKEGMDKSLAMLDLQMNQELENARLTIANKEQLEQAKTAIEEKYSKLREKIKEDEEKKAFKITEDALQKLTSLAADAAAQKYEAEITNLEKKKEFELEQIDAELQNQNLTESQRAELLKKREATEKQYNLRVAQEKERAWKAEQQAKIMMAIIDTASAVVEALPNIPLSVLAGALGAIQIGLIASQQPPKFHSGGTVGKTFFNASPSKEFPILVRGGEVIRTENQEKNLQKKITGTTLVFNFNSAVSDGAFVVNSIKKELKKTGLTIDRLVLNTAGGVTI
jgi:hypothetical protein